jgi:hypothetical protein
VASDPNLARSRLAGGQRPPEGSGIWNFTPQSGPSGPLPGSGSSPRYPSGPLNGSDSFGDSGAFGISGTFGGSDPRYNSGPLSGGNSFGMPGSYQPRPNAPPVAAERPQPSATFLARRPRRAPDVRDLMQVVTSHNLSRGHRTILLLADGEHTVLDLARLSSKPVDEVTALLGELESRGLIYYYN